MPRERNPYLHINSNPSNSEAQLGLVDGVVPGEQLLAEAPSWRPSEAPSINPNPNTR